MSNISDNNGSILEMNRYQRNKAITRQWMERMAERREELSIKYQTVALIASNKAVWEKTLKRLRQEGWILE